MRNIKLTLEYLGTNYAGFQKQSHIPTIEGELQSALREILNHPIKLAAAGRTDAGVHAIGQVVNFQTPSDIHTASLLKRSNSLLSSDIAISNAEEVEPGFHSRRSACWRRYHYRIFTRKAPSPFTRETSFHYPHHLNLSLLRSSLEKLAGTQDFSSFTTSGAQKQGSTKRDVFAASLNILEDLLILEITANAFLHHMMRFIAGTVLAIASEKISPLIISEMLECGRRPPICRSLPARGLVLIEVGYSAYNNKSKNILSNSIFG